MVVARQGEDHPPSGEQLRLVGPDRDDDGAELAGELHLVHRRRRFDRDARMPLERFEPEGQPRAARRERAPFHRPGQVEQRRAHEQDPLAVGLRNVSKNSVSSSNCASKSGPRACTGRTAWRRADVNCDRLVGDADRIIDTPPLGRQGRSCLRIVSISFGGRRARLRRRVTAPECRQRRWRGAATALPGFAQRRAAMRPPRRRGCPPYQHQQGDPAPWPDHPPVEQQHRDGHRRHRGDDAGDARQRERHREGPAQQHRGADQAERLGGEPPPCRSGDTVEAPSNTETMALNKSVGAVLTM